MKIISSNPYRLLGVYSNASKKDIVGAENKIKAHVKIGREISFKSDFVDFVGPIERTEESLATAVSQLTLAKDKIKFALFWFVHESAFDEVAFNHLSSNSPDSACQIWRKKNSASSFVNLAVSSLVSRQWANVLYYYSQLIESGEYDIFVKAIVGSEAQISKKEIVNLIIESLTSNFSEVNWLFFTNAKNIYIAGEKIEIGNSLSDSTLSKSFKSIYIDKIRDKINKAINEAEKIDRKNPTACLNAAKKLSRISSDFKALRSILPSSDIRYTSLSDKVADILDGLCKGYYNNSSDYRRARVIQPLVDAAFSFACSEGTKANCQEGVDFIDSKVEELPPEIIENDCQQLDNLLSKFITYKNNASLLICITSCRDILNRMKIKVGVSNDEFVKQSTMVARFALNTIIDEVNEKQKAYNDAPEFLDSIELSAYKESLRWAKPILDILAEFTMDADCRVWFTKNYTTLTSLYTRNCSPRSVSHPSAPRTTVSPRPSAPRTMVSPRPSTRTNPRPTSRPAYTPPPSKPASNDNPNAGCIIFAIIAAVIFVIFIIAVNSGPSSSSSSYGEEAADTTVCDTVAYEDSYYSSSNDNSYDTEMAVSQEDVWLDIYKGNSLSTGATPYRSKYGGNSKSGNAALKIKAPANCDVLVIIKNLYGDVDKHAYIKAGHTYSFTLRAGIYQPFFVFGNSWCPEKEAPNGEMGYFLEDVSISKDNPQEIGEYQELEYILQAVQGGNFHAAYSNADEAF